MAFPVEAAQSRLRKGKRLWLGAGRLFKMKGKNGLKD